jgi:hypothetical protein
LRRRLGAYELSDDPAVAERFDRRDALNPKRACEPGICVHIELDQLHGAIALGDLAFQDWTECPARPAPLRPEVDDDGY